MSQLRAVAKLVRFSPDEIARISQRARACGRTVARYIRETALGAIPKARHHVDRDALLRELARTGRDLARLAQLAESTSAGSPPAIVLAADGRVRIAYGAGPTVKYVE